MRTKFHESSIELGARRQRREAARVRRSLEPRVVDAAMDSDPVGAEDSHDALLNSLSKQLDLLQEQEQHIRSLLARAGYVRFDAANA